MVNAVPMGGSRGVEEISSAADPSSMTVKVAGVTLERVERIAGALPWEVEKQRSLCGETFIDDSDETNWTVTIEAKVSYSEFNEILTNAERDEDIRIVTAAKAGEVELDTIQYERRADFDTVQTEYGEEPLYRIQIQSQKNDGIAGDIIS